MHRVEVVSATSLAARSEHTRSGTLLVRTPYVRVCPGLSLSLSLNLINQSIHLSIYLSIYPSIQSPLSASLSHSSPLLVRHVYPPWADHGMCNSLQASKHLTREGSDRTSAAACVQSGLPADR